MHKKTIAFVIIILSLVLLMSAEMKTKVGNKLYVANPKNIEVISTIINLTDYWEKRHTDFPFSAEVRMKFLPYKDHPAVQLADKLIKKGWWQIYFFNIAVNISELPEGQPKSKPEWFEMVPVQQFIPLFKDFYQDSNYEEFWEGNLKFYEELQSSIVKRWKETGIDIVRILEDFYGFEFDQYVIVPAPQLADMGLHAELETDNKNTAIYFNGPLGRKKSEREGDYFAPVNALIYNAFHEYSHSFLEPVLNENQDLLQENSFIYDAVKEGMSKKGYESWDRVFMENLIHAVQICLIENAWSIDTASKALEREFNNGMLLIKDLYEILQDYEENQGRYKNFREFMPVIFEELGKRVVKDRRICGVALRRQLSAASQFSGNGDYPGENRKPGAEG